MAKENGDDQCGKCAALCCRYIGVALDDPETAGDFDDMAWFLHHEGTMIYVEDGDWYLNVEIKCKKLGKDNRCTIYEKRPRICRRHKHDECEFDGKPYDFEQQFNTAEELEAYGRKQLREKYAKKRKGGTRRKKPAGQKK
jgi:Fe-S-cluster containining protein